MTSSELVTVNGSLDYEAGPKIYTLNISAVVRERERERKRERE